MKCKYLFLLSLSVLLVSCGMDMELSEEQFYQERVKYNAEKRLGVTIDPNHTWSSITNGSITITADAPLNDITKVQILTESPYFNDNAAVLNETEVKSGDIVTLTFEAPNVYTRLIAACVNSQGHYYIQGFNIGESKVNFTSSNAGTRSFTRGTDDYPDISNMQLEYKNSTMSYNAARTVMANKASSNSDIRDWVNSKNLHLWEGKKWENERLWKLSNSNIGSSTWTVNNGTVFREVDAISENEATTLKDIFNSYLGRTKVNYNVQDNMSAIRNSNVFSLYNNHLISDGSNPITIIPVLTASSEISNCQLYYYYYNASDIPSGMSEEEYLKAIPKFKAVHCADLPNKGSQEFFKKNEYLLPYFGNPNDLMNINAVTYTMCTSDGVLYRIRNGQLLNNNYYYMTYTGADGNMSDKLSTMIEDGKGLANQLWQIFTTPDGNNLLYNVGSQKYICPNGEYTIMSTDIEKVKKNALLMSKEGDYYRFWRTDDNTLCLGTDLGVKNSKRVAPNKKVSDGDRSKWYIEPYEGAIQVTKKEDFAYSTIAFVKNAVSTVIPAGYRIGFMLRKGGDVINEPAMKTIDDVKKGCTFGDGRLNTEINQFPGHFGTAHSKYSMEIDDPRIAMFVANGKTYLTFEDGSDCNFSDMIIQVGGSSSTDEEGNPINLLNNTRPSGVSSIEEPIKVEAAAYTMCFEDRPDEADYDMNDVVIQASRINNHKVQISLVACGAQDKVILQVPYSHLLNNSEIHRLFGLDEDQYFVNTQPGGLVLYNGMSECIEIGSMSIEEYLKSISIKNLETGKVISMQETGNPPCAIIVPINFNYPMEKTSIMDAYPDFLGWVKNMNDNNAWYMAGEAEKIFTNLFSPRK